MLSEYNKRKQQLYNLLLRKSQVSTSSDQCCITIHSQEFSLAYARHTAGKFLLEFYASYPYDSQKGLKAPLSAIIKQYQLKKINCAWVLAPQDYQLLQIDALPVPDDEFQAAIRWKIKDLLRFPIDDVVIDHFALPASKISAINKIMVVAAQSSYLQKISEDIKAAGLSLSTIDIPELALRNIMTLFEQSNQSHALVYVQQTTIQLLITFQKQLYFSRNLEFGWVLSEREPDKLAQGVEQLVAEIQRSFDYYQSQWRQPNPTQMTLAATQLISAAAIDQLAQSLALPVRWLKPGDKLLTRQEMSFEQQGKYLPIMGELFRKEYEGNATTN